MNLDNKSNHPLKRALVYFLILIAISFLGGLLAYYKFYGNHFYVFSMFYIVFSLITIIILNKKLYHLEHSKNQELNKLRLDSDKKVNSLKKNIDILDRQLDDLNRDQENDIYYNDDVTTLLSETKKLKDLIFKIAKRKRFSDCENNLIYGIDECKRSITIISRKAINVSNKKLNDINEQHEIEISSLKNSLSIEKAEIKRLKDELNEMNKKIKHYNLLIKKVSDDSNNKINKNNNEHKKAINDLQKQFELLLSSKTPFNKVSTLVADSIGLIFKDGENYLRNKPHPALASANEVKKYYKQIARNYIIKYKEMQYRYEYLINLFPELGEYIENEEDLYVIDNNTDLEDFVDELKVEKDHSFDYLLDEEWQSLSREERNQLALDNYLKRDKSKLIIGLEYEMYIDYLLREDGFKTKAFGIERGLNDLGRDIIATKEIDGEIFVYIIQCKNWSASKLIHENVICQTYGTAVEYELNEHYKGLFPPKVIPVLCTTTTISETALKFANKLGVKIWNKPKGDYPMIKCNINPSTGEKIYHLPFDQQYWNTKIENDNEFYAWTVKEAENAGFRRAFRFTGLQNN